MNHLQRSGIYDRQLPALPGVQRAGTSVPRFKSPGDQAYATAFRPKGPSVNSQGREPLEMCITVLQAPKGRKSLSPRWGLHGLTRFYQGLTPLAINDGRVAADTGACKCITVETGAYRRRGSHVQPRRASVLVLTLVVVAMLTLGAAAFLERML